MPRLILLVVLFALGPFLAWAWFHVGTRPPEVTHELVVRTNLPGFKFKSLPVGLKEMEILATTNLFNGEFSDGRNRFTVFAAEWKADKAKDMSMLGHTPDICWVSVGFKPEAIGQPDLVQIEFPESNLAFECRFFRLPNSHVGEMALWCTLVGGRSLEEAFRFGGRAQTGDSGRSAASVNSRRRGANMFIRSVTQRSPSDGRKQFVRLSTSAAPEDPQRTVEELKGFARRWLDLHVVRAAEPGSPKEPVID